MEDQELISVLRKHVTKMKAELDVQRDRLRKIQEEMERISEKYRPAIELLKSLEGGAHTVTAEAGFPVEYAGFADLPIWKAALTILRDKKKRMSGREILNEMRKRGKEVNSPHAVYMISEALKRKPEFVKYKKVGRKNVFLARNDATTDKKKAEG